MLPFGFFAAAIIITAIFCVWVAWTAGKDAGHSCARDRYIQERAQDRDAHDARWENDAIRHGFGRYEQYLDRDGMQTRFAWDDSPQTKD